MGSGPLFSHASPPPRHFLDYSREGQALRWSRQQHTPSDRDAGGWFSLLKWTPKETPSPPLPQKRTERLRDKYDKRRKIGFGSTTAGKLHGRILCTRATSAAFTGGALCRLRR